MSSPWRHPTWHHVHGNKVDPNKLYRRRMARRVRAHPELWLEKCYRVMSKPIKKAIDEGKPIYCLLSRKAEDGMWIRSIGIWRVVADDFKGYPIALLTTIEAYRYDSEYKKYPIELTERQWRGLYSRCSLHKIATGE